MVEFIQFTEDRAANRAALAEGVKGIRCTGLRPVTKVESAALLKVVPFAGAVISSAEYYEGGAINAYVRIKEEGPAIGFIRVR